MAKIKVLSARLGKELRNQETFRRAHVAISFRLFQTWVMSEPLAVVYYANLLPGSQLASRLKDLGYRVRTIEALNHLEKVCQEEKPLFALVEIAPQKGGFPEIEALRINPATGHIPVLAFSASHDKTFQASARASGVSLVAASAAVLEQLPQLLDQALQVD